MEPIKCEERMPEDLSTVLVYCPDYPDDWFMATYLEKSYVYGEPMFYEMLTDIYFKASRITHWCPLPELPKARK